MKYKFRLVEEETSGGETSGGNKEKITYDLVLTPLGSTTQDTISALEKMDNYGIYVSNTRNSKADVEKAIINHFGPSGKIKISIENAFKSSEGNLELFKNNLIKKGYNNFLNSAEKIFDTLTKNKGQFYPKTNVTTMTNFIKTLSSKPDLLKWKVVGDTLVFPSSKNPTKKVTEEIIDTVMNNAGLDYDLESKESISELKRLVKEEIKKLLK
jgi:hypothetical protein